MPNTTWATAAEADGAVDADDAGPAEAGAGESAGTANAAEADEPDDKVAIDAETCPGEAANCAVCADAGVGGVADEAVCKGGVVEDRSKVGEETAEGVADGSNMTDDDDRTVCALSVEPEDCREGGTAGGGGAATGLAARAACSPRVATRHDSASSALLQRLDSERFTLARIFCLTTSPSVLRSGTDREGVGSGTTGL